MSRFVEALSQSFGMEAALACGIERVMSLRRNRWPHRMSGVLLSISVSVSVSVGWAQTFDFGYAPVGTTNQANGFYFLGGSYNGTNLVMSAEAFIGPNATDFSTSTNYTGQTLPPGPFYFYSLSFAPHAAGFETASLSTFETPSPPFGAGLVNLQGAGAPTNRPGSGPIVPELAPLEQAMTNFLVTRRFEAGTLALIHDSKLVFRQR